MLISIAFLAIFISATCCLTIRGVMAFPSLPDNSWYEVNPNYPHLITSQTSIGYDPNRGEIIMWGGHPISGVYPQHEEVFVYNVEQGRWRVDRPVGDSPPNY
jgi:hypothetical protein